MVYTGKQDDDQEATSRISRENLAERHQQIDNLLSRHPNARVTFAHFFFKADDLDGMADFLNAIPIFALTSPPAAISTITFPKPPSVPGISLKPIPTG